MRFLVLNLLGEIWALTVYARVLITFDHITISITATAILSAWLWFWHFVAVPWMADE